MTVHRFRSRDGVGALHQDGDTVILLHDGVLTLDDEVYPEFLPRLRAVPRDWEELCEHGPPEDGPAEPERPARRRRR